MSSIPMGIIIDSKNGIVLDYSRDTLLTDFGKQTLSDRYVFNGEDFQQMFSRVAKTGSDDNEHAQRLYDYFSKLWAIPATPVLSNLGTTRGLPVSCFLNETVDTLEGIFETFTENASLASSGGGIGTYWGNLRGIGAKVKAGGATSGIIPFLKVMDSATLAVSQGSLRRGSAAAYLDVWHPEIEEFLDIRRPSGGDINRRTLNLHHGVVINDKFMEAVRSNDKYDLICPKTKEVVRSVVARDLWQKILITRLETGEPYILFIDTVNRAIPEFHKKDDLLVKTSNLCIEISLPTNHERTAVCCLSQLNLYYYDQWKNDPIFIEDMVRFADNVLQNFIDNAPKDVMSKAIFSASQERSLGLGVMGFHSYLQSKRIPFESALAKSITFNSSKHIKKMCDIATKKLADEKGPCPDAERHGVMVRNANVTAIAPTASVSIIAGTKSPGIEPLAANAFTQKTLSGSFLVKNTDLEILLETKNQNTQKVWSSIITHEGSVQHLDFLDDDEKAVFKTAMELDQRWIIDHAASKQKFVDQMISTNLFLLSDVNKLTLHQLHFEAWEKGCKSLYYLRSRSIRQADKVSHKVERVIIEEEEKNQFDVDCLGCA